jgi:ABC-type multidrug transport system fused ATPase/permease subunit
MTTFKKISTILTPKERMSILVLLCLMVFGMLLEMLGVGILFPVMILLGQDNLGARHPRIQPVLEFLGNPTQNQLIVGAMLGLIVIYLIKNLFLAFLVWRQARVTFSIHMNLEQRLFNGYMRQPYTFHLQRNSAQLGQNIAEVNLFNTVATSSMTIFVDSLAMLGIASMLLLAEPLGVLIVIFVLGAAVLSFHYMTRTRITRWGTARKYHSAMRSQHLYQGLGGVKDVKLLGRESNFLEQFKLHSSRIARVGGSQLILQQLPRLWLELLAVAGLVLLVLTMLAQGKGVDRVLPTLALFAAAAFRLMPAVNRILSGVQSIRYSRPSISHLFKEFKLIFSEPEVTEELNSNALTLETEIRLSNISFVYPGASAPSLNDVSISIKKSESVGFIGPSGSGKSTLVDIILGLLSPNGGQVMVDGQDVQKKMRLWQNQIGYVPQSIYLTDDTLRHNVAFGLPNEEIDDVAVQRAIKDAQLEEFVVSLPNGLETIVGERGIRLSGGQRQRIGIARALYHDPAVLVLDEATSALDTATEQGVMQSVMALHGSKTILIVAHRLSTVEHCDRLYRLEHGKVVAEGSPTEMLVSKKVSSSV